MNAASLPQINMMRAIDAIGARVVAALHQKTSLDREALSACLVRNRGRLEEAKSASFPRDLGDSLT
jgi:hypothetical protein